MSLLRRQKDWGEVGGKKRKARRQSLGDVFCMKRSLKGGGLKPLVNQVYLQ